MTSNATPESAAQVGARSGDEAAHRDLAVPPDLHQRPVGEHVEIFDVLHRDLQRALAGIDGG